jgi:hypothetical protein
MASQTRVVQISWSAPQKRAASLSEIEFAEEDDEEYDDGNSIVDIDEKGRLAPNTKFLGRMVAGVERSNTKSVVAALPTSTNRAEGVALINRIAAMYGLSVSIDEPLVSLKTDAREVLNSKAVDAREILKDPELRRPLKKSRPDSDVTPPNVEKNTNEKIVVVDEDVVSSSRPSRNSVKVTKAVELSGIVEPALQKHRPSIQKREKSPKLLLASRLGVLPPDAGMVSSGRASSVECMPSRVMIPEPRPKVAGKAVGNLLHKALCAVTRPFPQTAKAPSKKLIMRSSS